MSTPPVPACDAPAALCGTPGGWRRGGRCTACTEAHRRDTNAARGIGELTADEREVVLRRLRRGDALEDAAHTIGRTLASLRRQVRGDSELRLASQGAPEEAQRAAAMGDYLAALARCGGNRTLAAAEAGLDAGVRGWRQLYPEFRAAEDAVGALTDAVSQSRAPAAPRVSDASLDRAVTALQGGASVPDAARSIGVHPNTLRYAGHRHAPLARELAQHGRRTRMGVPVRHRMLTDAERELLRTWWDDRSVTNREISQRLGATERQVRIWADDLHLPPRRRRARMPSPVGNRELEETVRAMWTDPEATLEDIAEAVGLRSRSYVSRLARQLGLPGRREALAGRRQAPDGAEEV